MPSISEIIINELDKYRSEISIIDDNIRINCITIFSTSDNNYIELNKELSKNRLIDEMSSGNLYFLDSPINTEYGKLYFIKVRKYDENYNNYRISVDFTVDNYEKFKSKISNPVIKKYDNFELIQFKTSKSIINIVSIGAREEYNIKGE